MITQRDLEAKRNLTNRAFDAWITLCLDDPLAEQLSALLVEFALDESVEDSHRRFLALEEVTDIVQMQDLL